MSILKLMDALTKVADQEAHQIELDAGKLQSITGEPYSDCLQRITAMRHEMALRKIAEQISQIEN